MTYTAIIISALFVNNVVLAYFYGAGAMLFRPDTLRQTLWLAAAMLCVALGSLLVVFPLDAYLLRPWGLDYLRLLLAVLVVALFSELAAAALKRWVADFRDERHLSMLLVTNAALLAITLLAVGADFTLSGALAYGIASAVGFGIVMFLFVTIRQQLLLADLPRSMRGLPIALIVLAILAMAFRGFAGV